MSIISGHQKKLMLAIKKVKGQKGLYGSLPGAGQSGGVGQSLGNNNNNNQTPIIVTRHPSLDMGNPHARPITVRKYNIRQVKLLCIGEMHSKDAFAFFK